MKFLVTGGTGFVGSSIVSALLARDYKVLVVSRKKQRSQVTGLEFWQGNLEKEILPLDLISDVDGVINLMGESLIGSWSKDHRKRMISSRIKGTENLVKSFNKRNQKLKVFISSSAVGYYIKNQEHFLYESSPFGSDFLSRLCFDWEKSAFEMTSSERICIIRLGLVLGIKGGFFQRILLGFKAGFAVVFGDGGQYLSWISLDDVTRGILFLIESVHLQDSVYNFCSPHSVTNREMMELLASFKGRRTLFRVPSFILRLILREGSSLLLSSQKVFPGNLLKNGFHFRHAVLKNFVHECLGDLKL